MSSSGVSHPLFARFFDGFSHLMEREAGRYRDELLTGLEGRVVEIGAGNGINFRRYPGTVTEVVAVEPEAYMRRRAERAAREAPAHVEVREGTAEALPVEDQSCDAAVLSLVICSVGDVDAALAEVRRVLRPSGELRFFEHIRSGSPRKARVQEWLDGSGLWPALVGGCHCARSTVGAIQAAGFHVEQEREVEVGPGWSPTNPHAVGVARLAGTP